MSGNKKNTLSKRVEQLEIIMGITNNGIIDKNGIVINMVKTKTKLEEIENKIKSY